MCAQRTRLNRIGKEKRMGRGRTDPCTSNKSTATSLHEQFHYIVRHRVK